MSIRQENGFTLVGILVALALVGFVFLSLAHMQSLMAKNQVRNTTVTTAQMLRQNLSEILKNDASWAQMLQDSGNSTFQCLARGEDCSAYRTESGGRAYRVLTPTREVFFDGLNPRQGWTRQGQLCTDYPSSSCVLRAELTWRALCSPATCIFPQVELMGKLVFTAISPDQNMAFNPENYRVSVIRKTLPDMPAPALPSPPALASPPQALPPEQVATLCQLARGSMGDAAAVTQMKRSLTSLGYSSEAVETALEYMKSQCK